MSEFLAVDDLSFEVRRSQRRKTISILVDRGGQLVISAPEECSQAVLLSAIQNKKQWIYTQLMDKEKIQIHTPIFKEYVSGEGFFYLGKSYRLQVIEPIPNQACTPILQLFHGQFLLRKDERYNGREHFVSWYTSHCRLWLIEHLPRLAHRIGVEPPALQVMNLGYRWGSCSTSQVSFHWRVIMLPLPVIEYVVVHELVHILEPNHSAKFWQLIERILPEWQEKKLWLAENGNVYNIQILFHTSFAQYL
jgi:predicted metal-dependent hydrolase